MATIPVLLNRGGGAVAADKEIREKVVRSFERVGIDADAQMIAAGDCALRCSAIAKRRDPLVIVGGGDGTVSAAASALVGTDTLLGILPLGTLNHFARDLGIPTDLDDAAKLIAERPSRSVDVGEMNERVFINNSAIGLYPLMVIDRDMQRRRLGRSKRLAMLLASLRALARFNHYRLTLTVNDERTGRVDTPLLFVGNNDYRIDIGAPGKRERVDGGELCVLVLRKNSRRGLIAASIRALLGRSRENDMVRLDDVQRLRVTSRRSQLAVSLDGEVVRAGPSLDYRLRTRALNVIAR